MGRKQIPENIKKIKVCISIDRELNEYLNSKTYNKSKFIEDLIKNKKDEK